MDGKEGGLRNLDIVYSSYDKERGIVLPEMSNELAYLCGFWQVMVIYPRIIMENLAIELFVVVTLVMKKNFMIN